MICPIEELPESRRRAFFSGYLAFSISLLFHAAFLISAVLAIPPFFSADDQPFLMRLEISSLPSRDGPNTGLAAQAPILEGKPETAVKNAAVKEEQPTTEKPASKNPAGKKSLSGAKKTKKKAAGAGGLQIPAATGKEGGARESGGSAHTAAGPDRGVANAKPVYPELARKRGQEGIVRLRCRIDSMGKILSISVAESSGFRLLDEAALQAVSQWVFKPAVKNGDPREDTIIVPVQFRLE